MRLRIVPEGAVSPLQLLSVVLIVAMVVGIYYLSTQITITGNVASQSTAELGACSSDLSECKGSLAGSVANLETKTQQFEACDSDLTTCRESLGITSGSEQACRTDLQTCASQRDSTQEDFSECSSDLGTCSSEKDELVINYNALADSYAKFKCCQSGNTREFYTISGNTIICTDNEGSGTRPTGC